MRLTPTNENANGNQLAIRDPNNVGKNYDAANRQTGVTYPNGQQITRTWTPRNRLATVAVNGTTIATYSRDAGNRTTGLAYGNGVVNNWEYRGDNHIRRVAAMRGNQAITDFAYSLDADKRRTAEQNGVTPLLSNGYGYDQKDQLTTWNRTDGKTGAWNLSPGGDWRSVTYDGITETRTHDAAHELLARNSQPLTYDTRGNLLTDNHGNVYAWDVENRLTSITPTTVSEGAQKVTFAYDTQWRRVAKQVYAWSTDHWTLSTSHTFTYDGWNLNSETISNQQSTISNSYIWGEDLSGSLQGAGGIGGLLAGILTKNEEPGTKNLVYYHYQANGNVMALTDANGATAASYIYNPYGTLLSATGPLAMVNPMRFSSKYTDDETGLLYYGYRMYNPMLGRWINRDPIAERGGLNLYGMLENGVINQQDLTGLAPPGAIPPVTLPGLFPLPPTIIIPPIYQTFAYYLAQAFALAAIQAAYNMSQCDKNKEGDPCKTSGECLECCDSSNTAALLANAGIAALAYPACMVQFPTPWGWGPCWGLVTIIHGIADLYQVRQHNDCLRSCGNLPVVAPSPVAPPSGIAPPAAPVLPWPLRPPGEPVPLPIY